jgi:hypothetical protein
MQQPDEGAEGGLVDVPLERRAERERQHRADG